MALTDEEKVKVYQVLGIPTGKPAEYQKDLSVQPFLDNQGGFPEYPFEYSTDAINRVNTRIGELTAAEEAAVIEILDEWDSIKFETVRVETDKIKLNYDYKRSHLRSMLLNIISVYVKGYSMNNPMLSIG